MNRCDERLRGELPRFVDECFDEELDECPCLKGGQGRDDKDALDSARAMFLIAIGGVSGIILDLLVRWIF